MKHILILFLFVASAFAARPVLPEQKLREETYYVCCLACDKSGQANYHLKPRKAVCVGTRSEAGGNIREIMLRFKCPKRHQFDAPAELFVPVIRPEKVK